MKRRVVHNLTRLLAFLLVLVMACSGTAMTCMAETAQDGLLAAEAEAAEEEESASGAPLWDLSEVSVPELVSALEAYDPAAGRTELEEERAKDSTTWLRSDGFKDTVFYSEDIRFLDEDGNLMDYDPELVPLTKTMKKESGTDLGGYRFVNREGDKKHYLPERLSEETPVVMENGDYRIAFWPVEENGSGVDAIETGTVALKKAEVTDCYGEASDKNVLAEYGSATGTMEFGYESLNQGLKETVTLKEKPGTNRISYVLELGGIWPRKNATDKGISLYAGEDLVGSIGAPFMDDATGEAYSEDITYELKELGEGRWLLTMLMSEEYLSSEERVWPVTVDPTATWTGSSKVDDVYVLSGSAYKGLNFYDSGTVVMPAGTGSQGVSRTYLKFTDLATTIKGKYVASASLKMYETGDSDAGGTIQIYRAAKAWNKTTLAWSNQPGIAGSSYSSFTSSGKPGDSRGKPDSVQRILSGWRDGILLSAEQVL